jgi:hypothetical protein
MRLAGPPRRSIVRVAFRLFRDNHLRFRGDRPNGRANERAALGSAVAMRARRAPRDCGDPRDAKCLGSRATVRPPVLTRNRLEESAHRATLDRSRDALPLIPAAVRAAESCLC